MGFPPVPKPKQSFNVSDVTTLVDGHPPRLSPSLSKVSTSATCKPFFNSCNSIVPKPEQSFNVSDNMEMGSEHDANDVPKPEQSFNVSDPLAFTRFNDPDGPQA